MTGRRSFVVSADEDGLRLDQALAKRVPELSRAKARVLIEQGSAFVDRKRVKVASRLVRKGQALSLEALAPIASVRLNLDDMIVCEDSSLVVFNKPSGLLSAPTPESDQNNLHRAAEVRNNAQLWLVHRLDRPTSGLIVFAKTKQAAAKLSQALVDHSMRRQYLAILLGQLGEPTVTVRTPIEGRAAATQFSTLERRGGQSLVRAQLETGRTHQVRIHATSLGCPVVGDRRHGVALLGRPEHPSAPRLLLHAAQLSFIHPATGRPVEFECPLPPDMGAYWELVGPQHFPEAPVL